MPNVSGAADRSNLSVTYEDENGNRIVKSGGKRPWRNNNPGNIIKGETARRLGAIGDDGIFAVFPDVKTGAKAMDSLLKGSRYQSLSLGDAIARWSANEDEVLEAYRRRVEEWTGLGRDRPMSSLTPEEFARVVEAMQRQEGIWAPDPETRKKTILKGVVIHEPADPPTRPARDAPQPPSGKPAGSNRPGVPVPPPPQRRNEAPAPQKGAAAESLRPAVLGGVGDLPGFGGAAPTAPVAAPARPPAKPETGLDRLQALFGRPFEHLVQTSRGRVPVDDPAVLHVDEIDALMAAPAYRQSLHPQAEKTRCQRRSKISPPGRSKTSGSTQRL